MMNTFEVLSKVVSYFKTLKAVWIPGLMFGVKVVDNALVLKIEKSNGEFKNFTLLTREDNETLLNDLTAPSSYSKDVRKEIKFILSTGGFDKFLEANNQNPTKEVKQVLEVEKEIEEINSITQSQEYKNLIEQWHVRNEHVQKITLLGAVYEERDQHPTEPKLWINEALNRAYWTDTGKASRGVMVSTLWDKSLPTVKALLKTLREDVNKFYEEMGVVNGIPVWNYPQAPKKVRRGARASKVVST